MKVENIDNFKAGWLVGNFEPALIKSTDFEMAIQTTPAGTYIERHYQKVSTEYNCIVSGKVIANGETLSTGDIFIYAPGEITELEIIEDVTIVVFKTPSAGIDDKVICK